MFTDEKTKQIRTGDLTLHCIEVEIFQAVENGLRMLGYGTIKINSIGTIYLEFICTYSENVPRAFFNEKLPKDPLNHEHNLHLRVKTLNGDEYKSNGFSVQIDINSSRLPAHHYITLSSIYTVSTTELKEDNYLYFQFAERSSIPPNKSNTLESSLGSKSYSWNQTVLEMDSYLISIVSHKGYTEVNTTGIFEPEELLECLKFYIGFSSSSMPQFYYVKEIKNGRKREVVSSIDNKQKLKHSSSPMIDSIADEKYRDFAYHYSLLENIINLYRENPKQFESIYSQWERVWHSFQSKNSIMILTLSVAIEGLLNDIYIPAIKIKNNDIELDAQIDNIKQQIKSLELTSDQRSRLIGSVSYWKSITAAKALGYLIERGVVTTADKKLWQELRNESAHPKVREENLDKERLELEQVLSCLNLFHKLILNTLSFSGPIILLQADRKFTCVELIHKDILS